MCLPHLPYCVGFSSMGVGGHYGVDAGSVFASIQAGGQAAWRNRIHSSSLIGDTICDVLFKVGARAHEEPESMLRVNELCTSRRVASVNGSGLLKARREPFPIRESSGYPFSPMARRCGRVHRPDCERCLCFPFLAACLQKLYRQLTLLDGVFPSGNVGRSGLEFFSVACARVRRVIVTRCGFLGSSFCSPAGCGSGPWRPLFFWFRPRSTAHSLWS